MMSIMKLRLQEALEAIRSAGPDKAWPALLLPQGPPWWGDAQAVPAGEAAVWAYEHPRIRGYRARVSERGIYVGPASQFAGFDVRRMENPALQLSGWALWAVVRLLEAAVRGSHKYLERASDALTFMVKVPAGTPWAVVIEGKSFLTAANAAVKKMYIPADVYLLVKPRPMAVYSMKSTGLVQLRLDEDRFLARR